MEDSQQGGRQGSQREVGLRVGHWDSRADLSRAGSQGMSRRGRGDRSHREQGGRGAVSERAGRGERAGQRAETGERGRQWGGAGERELEMAYEGGREYLQEGRRGLGGQHSEWRRGAGGHQQGAWRRWS